MQWKHQNDVNDVSNSFCMNHMKGAKHFEDLQQSVKFIKEKSYEYEVDKRNKEKQIPYR